MTWKEGQISAAKGDVLRETSMGHNVVLISLQPLTPSSFLTKGDRKIYPRGHYTLALMVRGNGAGRYKIDSRISTHPRWDIINTHKMD